MRPWHLCENVQCNTMLQVSGCIVSVIWTQHLTWYPVNPCNSSWVQKPKGAQIRLVPFWSVHSVLCLDKRGAGIKSFFNLTLSQPYIDGNSAGSAGTGRISIHAWAGLLYTGWSTDWLVYNQPVCFFLINAGDIILKGRLPTVRIQYQTRKDLSLWMEKSGFFLFNPLVEQQKKKV